MLHRPAQHDQRRLRRLLREGEEEPVDRDVAKRAKTHVVEADPGGRSRRARYRRT